MRPSPLAGRGTVRPSRPPLSPCGPAPCSTRSTSSCPRPTSAWCSETRSTSSVVTARTGTLPDSIYFILSEADFRVVFRDKIHICRPRRGLKRRLPRRGYNDGFLVVDYNDGFFVVDYNDAFLVVDYNDGFLVVDYNDGFLVVDYNDAFVWMITTPSPSLQDGLRFPLALLGQEHPLPTASSPTPTIAKSPEAIAESFSPPPGTWYAAQRQPQIPPPTGPETNPQTEENRREHRKRTSLSL